MESDYQRNYYNNPSQPIPPKQDDVRARKSIWKWILLYVLIGAVAYGLIYYFFFAKNGGYNYNSQNYQNQTQNNSEITNWKTLAYNHYEFEYPSTWNVWMTLESRVPAGCFAQGDSVCANFNGLAFSVNVLPWNENTCKQYWNGAGGAKAILQETKMINGKKFYYGKFQDDNLEVYHIFFNNSCFELAKTISDNQDLNKILSTLKFTK